MRPNILLPVSAALLASSLLWGCLGEDENPHGSEVENEMTVGRLYLADGKPAANARVRIYPVDHQPFATPLQKTAELVFATYTDKDGYYRIDSLEAGQYNILGDRDEARSLRDSVFLSASPQSLPPDTLLEPGALFGVVALQPNHDLRTVTLQLLGTNEYVNADRQGRFGFRNLAEGRYRMRVTTTVEDYTPLFVGVTIRSGHSDTLADTLRPDYTGIPVVTGLRVAYDTAAGIATLSWSPADFGNLWRYEIFRDSVGTRLLSTEPYDFSEDTVFHDTLFPPYLPLPESWGGSWRVPPLEYRVRILDKSAIPGLAFGSVKLVPAPPTEVRTVTTLEVANGRDGAVSLGDSMVLVARFLNPTRENRRVRWFVGEEDDPARTKELAGKSSADTLRHVAPREAGPLTFRIEVTDEADSTWMSGHEVRVVEDPPVAFAGQDTLVYYKGGEVRLRGRGTDGFGRIEKYEWDIGATGRFVRTGAGDTAFTVDSISLAGLACILKVTDEDGLSDVDTLVVHPLVSRIISTMPKAGYDMAAVVHEGRLLLFGGVIGDTLTGESWAFDPASRAWNLLAPMPEPRRSSAAAMVAGRVEVVGGKERSNDGRFLEVSSRRSYDPAGDSWQSYPISTFPSRPGLVGAIGLGASLYVIDYRGLHYVKPEVLGIGIYWAGISAATVLEGKLYIFQDRVQRRSNSQLLNEVAVFKPEENTFIYKWTFLPPAIDETVNFNNTVIRDIAAVGTRVYMHRAGTMVSFETVSSASRKEPKPLLDRTDGAMCAVNGKIYFVGGVDRKTGLLDPRVEEYIPID